MGLAGVCNPMRSNLASIIGRGSMCGGRRRFRRRKTEDGRRETYEFGCQRERDPGRAIRWAGVRGVDGCGCRPCLPELWGRAISLAMPPVAVIIGAEDGNPTPTPVSRFEIFEFLVRVEHSAEGCVRPESKGPPTGDLSSLSRPIYFWRAPPAPGTTGTRN